jgi:hypothetical protein
VRLPVDLIKCLYKDESEESDEDDNWQDEDESEDKDKSENEGGSKDELEGGHNRQDSVSNMGTMILFDLAPLIL